MTGYFKAVRITGLAAALFAASVATAHAELQDCFRDGYACSIKCDTTDKDKADFSVSGTMQRRREDLY